MSPRRPFVLAVSVVLALAAAPATGSQPSPAGSPVVATPAAPAPAAPVDVAVTPVPAGRRLPVRVSASAYDARRDRLFAVGRDPQLRRSVLIAVDVVTGRVRRALGVGEVVGVMVDERGDRLFTVSPSGRRVSVVSLRTLEPVRRYQPDVPLGSTMQVVAGYLWTTSGLDRALTALDLESGTVSRFPTLGSDAESDPAHVGVSALAADPARPRDLLVGGDDGNGVVHRVRVVPGGPRPTVGSIARHQTSYLPRELEPTADGRALFAVGHGDPVERLGPETLAPRGWLAETEEHWLSVESTGRRVVAGSARGVHDGPEVRIYERGRFDRPDRGYEIEAPGDCCIEAGEPVEIVGDGLYLDGNRLVLVTGRSVIDTPSRVVVVDVRRAGQRPGR